MTRRAPLLSATAVYVVVTLTPLFVILLGPTPPERGFWVEFGVAIGFIGLAMLGLQSVLTARYPRVSSAIGQDTLLQFHRQAGLVAFGLVLAHPIVLISADSGNWEFLDVRVNLLRAAFLIFVLFALPAIIVTSLWRERLRIPYEWWRISHGLLAMAIVMVGLVHITRVHYYLESVWKQALWVAIGVASIGSVLYVRALKPLRVGRRPYRVSSVEPVASRTWVVSVEPDDPPALDFDAGQFAFLTIADSPFSLQQHPFSIASSARREDTLEFAIKELGDFTDQIGTVPAGRRAFVDGPYGSMRLATDRGAGLLLVAGGIGISPVLSMLRTLADSGDDRTVVLVYANERVEDIAFADEIEAMRAVLDLRVVLVLEHPPAGWSGPVGHVTPELLAAHLPARGRAEWRCVVCGPAPLMEIAERSLLDLGVPLGRIHSERFDIGAAGAVGRRSVQVRRLVIGLGVVMVLAAALFAI